MLRVELPVGLVVNVVDFFQDCVALMIAYVCTFALLSYPRPSMQALALSSIVTIALIHAGSTLILRFVPESPAS